MPCDCLSGFTADFCEVGHRICKGKAVRARSETEGCHSRRRAVLQSSHKAKTLTDKGDAGNDVADLQHDRAAARKHTPSSIYLFSVWWPEFDSRMLQMCAMLRRRLHKQVLQLVHMGAST